MINTICFRVKRFKMIKMFQGHKIRNPHRHIFPTTPIPTRFANVNIFSHISVWQWWILHSHQFIFTALDGALPPTLWASTPQSFPADQNSHLVGLYFVNNTWNMFFSFHVLMFIFQMLGLRKRLIGWKLHQFGKIEILQTRVGVKSKV